MEMSLKQLSQMYRHMIKQTLKKGIKKQKRDWWSKLTPAEQKLLTREAKSKGVSPRSLKTATVFKLGGLIRRPKCASTEKKFLDLNLMKEAQKARVPITGLDNPIKRANEFLALKRSEADHFFVLREELKRLHLRRHYVETMVQMYHRGQAERFLAFESAARKAYVPKRFHRATEQFLQNDILKGRNKEWMPAIIGQMAKGNVVTAIGAAHLPGRLGVLNLLKKNGFSVKKLDL